MSDHSTISNQKISENNNIMGAKLLFQEVDIIYRKLNCDNDWHSLLLR